MTSVKALLWQLGDRFASVTASEPLLAMSEGHIKVRLLETALGLGWTLQEGAGGHVSGGRVADYIQEVDNRITWSRGPRILSLSTGSADLAVVLPLQFLLEIKGRPDFGTKSQSQFQAMYEDVCRVGAEVSCCFLFVLDEKTYRAFSGEKLETRGRPASEAPTRWFRMAFLPTFDIPHTGVNRSVAIDGTGYDLRFWKQQPHADRARFLVAGVRA